MSVNSSWTDDTKTLLYLQFSGQWNWDEYHAARDSANHLVNEINHPYFTVLDFTQAEGLPANMLSKFRKESQNAPAHRQGVIVISKQAHLAKTFINMILKLTKLGCDIRFATTFEEAKQFIDENLLTSEVSPQTDSNKNPK